MNILITGGTGFIGQRLCAALRRDAHHLWVLSRQPDRVPDTCGNDVQGLGSLDELDGSVQIDAVINLAGEPIADKRWSDAQKQKLVNSRMNTTRAINDWIQNAEHKPAVLISGSAIGFYGDTGAREISEDSPPVNEFTHQLCRDWEDEALKAEAHGVRVALLRTGIVLGKGGGALSKMLPAFRFGLGGPIGRGDQWMSWIHRDDMVSIILFLLKHDNLSGAFNATAPHAVMNRQFTRTLGEVLRRPTILPMPAFVLKLLFGEMSHLLLTGQKVVPQRLLDQGYAFRFEELDSALREILKK